MSSGDGVCPPVEPEEFPKVSVDETFEICEEISNGLEEECRSLLESGEVESGGSLEMDDASNLDVGSHG